MLLLPVAIALAITGALAYTMTREGAISVSAVDDQYDIEVARYLAEGGVRLAKWQSEKRGCNNPARFATVALPGGSVVANSVTVNGGEIDIVVTATSTARAVARGGAVNRLERKKLAFFDRKTPDRVSLDDNDGEDTFVRIGSGKQGDANYLEATDGKSHPLLKFSLGLADNVRIVKAELSLYQYYSNSVQVERALAVHPVTRNWNKDATWTSSFASAGGDYEANPAATVAIAANGRYTWQITPLVARWVVDKGRNYGVLFKPLGLNEARFYSLNNAFQKPGLVIDYNKRCNALLSILDIL